MLRFLTCIVFILIYTGAISQKVKNGDVPEFGKIEKADLELKECDFDKKAEAMVLFDVGELDSYSGELQLERHVRIKILNDKGLDNADIKITYHSFHNDESIRNLVAQTYNLDEAGNIVVTKVDKKSIFEKKLDKAYTQMVFTFPEVKVGSVIEYKYTHTNVGLLNWIFQDDIPVRYSRYRIDAENIFEINTIPYVSLPMEASRDEKSTRTVQNFSMKNIPALRNEAYITCDDDYAQRIETRLVSINTGSQRINRTYTWPQVVKALMEDEDFGVQLKKNIPRTDDLDALLRNVQDPFQKMKIIHSYVKKNMEWDGYYSIWAGQGVKSAWKDKKGTAGEINLILVNLLKDAGLHASPILVSTRKHGRINTLFPNIRDFNKVLAYVEIDDKTYVLDATDKYTPSHLIPYDVMYSEGLVITKYETFEWGWRPLFNEKELMKNITILKFDIDKDGMISGEANVNSYDLWRCFRAPDLSKGKDKFKDEYFSSPNPGLTIDEFSLQNEDNDSLPLVQKIKFHAPASSSGDYKYFTVNMFTGLESNPFVADERFSDVFFGANQNYSIVAIVTIPEDYAFEELPKSMRMIMPDTSISFTRRLAAENNQLSVRINLEFKKAFFTAQEYPDFQEFYKKLFGMLNEQFVIKKKAKP